MNRLGLILLVTLASGCGGPSGEAPFTLNGPPRAAFPPVGDALLARCGSLDCHGTVARNLRVYGLTGLRIDGITGQGATTAAEHDATYTSIVSIQPETLAEVLGEAGARPERWIVVSKGNGREAHKGGKAMPEGSSADRCVRSWLAGTIDVAACQDAAEYLPPQPP